MIERQCDASMQFCLNVSMQQCYSGVSFMPSSNVAVTVSDNDAGVTLSKNTLEVSEGGAATSFSISLNSLPGSCMAPFAVGMPPVAISESVITHLFDSNQSLSFFNSDGYATWREAMLGNSTLQQEVQSIGLSAAHFTMISAWLQRVDLTTAEAMLISCSHPALFLSGWGSNVYPGSDVVISLTGNSDLTISPSNLTFTPNNWHLAQTVSVSAVNDDFEESTESHVIQYSFSSTDLQYNSLNASVPIWSLQEYSAANADTVVTIFDDDNSGVTISKSSLHIAEGGANDSYTVVLNSSPAQRAGQQEHEGANVTIALTGANEQVTLSSQNLTFTSQNWNQPQVVHVSAVNDHVDEQVEFHTIWHSASSTEDPAYQGAGLLYSPGSVVTAELKDNDVSAVTLSRQSVFAREGGVNGTYAVVLETSPSASRTELLLENQPANVTLNLTCAGNCAGQLQMTPSSLTFTSDNWNQPQLVTVTAITDSLVEELAVFPIVHAPYSSDGNYNGVNATFWPSPNIYASIVDPASVNISKSEVSPVENGTNDSYEISLGSVPGFGAIGWNPNRLFVDICAEDVTTVTTIGSALLLGNLQTAGLVVRASCVPTAETLAVLWAKSDTLSAETCSLLSSFVHTQGGQLVTHSGNSHILFDALFSNCASVTTAGTKLGQCGSNTTKLKPVHQLSADDLFWQQTLQAKEFVDAKTYQYNSDQPQWLHVPFSDQSSSNASCGFDLSGLPGTVSLGGWSSSSVSLAYRTSGHGRVWLFEAEWSLASSSSDESDRKMLAAMVAGGRGLVDIRKQAPTADSCVSRIEPVSLDFSGGTVLRVDSEHSSFLKFSLYDLDTTVSEIKLRLLKKSSGQGNLQVDVTRNTWDDEVAMYSNMPQSTNRTQGCDSPKLCSEMQLHNTSCTNCTEFYTVSCTVPGGQSYAPVCSTVSGQICPTTSKTGLNDSARDEFVSHFTSSQCNSTAYNSTVCVDNGCNGITTHIVLPCNLDSCAAGNLTREQMPEAANTFIEIDVTDAVKRAIQKHEAYVSIQLHTDPSSSLVFASSRDMTASNRPELLLIPQSSQVKISISPNNLCMYTGRCEPKVTVVPSVLIFTGENWFTPQSVVVQAVDDQIDLDQPSVDITHSVVSLDPDYVGGGVENTGLSFSPSVNVTALTVDNDVAAIQLSRAYLSVNEGGASDSYSVVLASDPIANVTVTIYGSSQAYASVSTLLFTRDNWNLPQMVTIIAIDDVHSENSFAGSHDGGVIRHSSFSADFHYDSTLQCLNSSSWDNIALQNCQMPVRYHILNDSSLLAASFEHGSAIKVTVFDNDPAVSVSKSQVTVTEGGINDTISVVLNAPPAASNWDVATVRPQWHSISQGPRGASGHPGTPFAINDTLSNEGGRSVVTVTLSSDSQVTITPASLTFDGTNWNLARVVVITATDDFVDEDTEIHSIQLSVSSADSTFSGIVPFWSSAIHETYNANPDFDFDPMMSTVTATVHDDDSVGVRVSTLQVQTAEVDYAETSLYQKRHFGSGAATSIRYIRVDIRSTMPSDLGFSGISVFSTNDTETAVYPSVAMMALNATQATVSELVCYKSTFTAETSVSDAYTWVVFDLGTPIDVSELKVIRNTGCGSAEDEIAVNFFTKSEGSLFQQHYLAGFTSRFSNVTGMVNASVRTADWELHQQMNTPEDCCARQVQPYYSASAHCFCNSTCESLSARQGDQCRQCTDGYNGSSCQYPDAVTCGGNGKAQGDGSCECNNATVGTNCQYFSVDVNLFRPEYPMRVQLGNYSSFSQRRLLSVSDGYESYSSYNSFTETLAPTASPTVSPTPPPTSQPTASPTLQPTPFPTPFPTASPTAYPTTAEQKQRSIYEDGANFERPLDFVSVSSHPSSLSLLQSPYDYSSVILRGSSRPGVYWRFSAEHNETFARNTGTLGAAMHGSYVSADTSEIQYVASGVETLNPSKHPGMTVESPWVSDNLPNGAIEMKSGSVVSVTNVPAVQGASGAATVELWVFLKAVPIQQIVLLSGAFYNLSMNAGGAWAFETKSASVSGGGVAVNSWQHVVGTFNGTHQTLYVNNTIVSSASVNMSFSNQSTANDDFVTLGCDGFNGLLDEVALYNQALSAQEVAEHWHAVVGNPSFYHVQLESQPLSEVTVQIHSESSCYKANNLCNVTVSPTALTFTPSTWNSSQTVRVSAVNDDLDEAPVHKAMISHTASSNANSCRYTGDGNALSTVCRTYNRYDGIGIHDVEALIADNDVSFVNISKSSIFVKELSYGDSYSISLATQPQASVTVTLRSDVNCTRVCGLLTDPKDCGDTNGNKLCNTSVLPGSMTFSPSNWGVPQTVQVVAVDDDLDEPFVHTTTILHRAVSSDVKYNATPEYSTLVSIVDDDVSFVNVSKSVLHVMEGGATDNFTVVLNTEPWYPVTVNLHTTQNCYRRCGYCNATQPALFPSCYPQDPADCGSTNNGSLCNATVWPTMLVFNKTNWNVPQNVTVFAVDDWLDEDGHHLTTIAYSTETEDRQYSAIDIEPTTVNITDNDVSGFLMYQLIKEVAVNSSNSTANYSEHRRYCGNLTANGADCVMDVEEGGMFDFYEMFLTSEPRANVTVKVTDTGKYGYGAHLTQAAYPRTPALPLIPEKCNDTAHAESTGCCPYYNCQNETILTFTPQNWKISQAVQVTAVNDATEEPDVSVTLPYHLGGISHTAFSGDSRYNAFALPGIQNHIGDNGNSSIVLRTAGGAQLSTLAITEAGLNASFTVQLSSEPWKPVTISFTTDYPRDARIVDYAVDGGYRSQCHRENLCNMTVSPAQLVFSPGDWDSKQTVTIFAVDDALDEPWPTIQGAYTSTPKPAHTTMLFGRSTSEDEVYAKKMVSDVHLSITDNDESAVLVSRETVFVEESGLTDVYSVSLSSEPWADTRVDIHRNIGCYRALSAINFDEVCNVSTNVNGEVAKFSMLFQAGNFTNWNVPFNVTVVANDDSLDEYDIHNNMIQHSISCTGQPACDKNYENIVIGEVNVSIQDNDNSGVIFMSQTKDTSAATTGPNASFIMTVTEYGGGIASNDVNVYEYTRGGDQTYDDHYWVYLATEPFDEEVQVKVVSKNPWNGISVTGKRRDARQLDALEQGDKILKFTNKNWNVAQIVTVVAIDDNYDERAEVGKPAQDTAEIWHEVTSTHDRYYNGIESHSCDLWAQCDPLNLPVNIIDNDLAMVMVSKESVTVFEGGATANFTLQLGTEPFPGLSNTRATVTLSVMDGHCLDGAGKPYFDVLCSVDTTADYCFNQLQPYIGNLAANAKCKTLTKALVSPSSIEFLGSTSWNEPHQITVTAYSDSIVEELIHKSSIIVTCSSPSPKYNYVEYLWSTVEVPGDKNSLVQREVSVRITDDDLPDLLMSQDLVYVAEGTLAGTHFLNNYTVALKSEPWSDVTVTTVYGTQLLPMTAEIIFKPSDWNVSQLIAIAAVDDNLDETKPHFDYVKHTLTSLDAAYNKLPVGFMNVSIMDNDFAGVMTKTSTGQDMFVAEGTPQKAGFNDEYFVKLQTEPLFATTIVIDTPYESLVMIKFNESSGLNDTVSKVTQQLSFDTILLVFTPSNWDNWQMVTVSAVRDNIKEGPYNPLTRGTDTGNHMAVITHAVHSEDGNYNGSWLRAESCESGFTVIPPNSTSAFNHPDKEALYTLGRQTKGMIRPCGNCTLADDAECPASWCCPEVGAPALSVQITEDDPSPAPNLLRAIFSDTGASIIVTFDSTTDRGDLSGAFPCSKLFVGTVTDPQKGTSTLINGIGSSLGRDESEDADDGETGPYNSCGWTDDDTVVISLGSGAVIVPAEFLKIVDNKVKASPNAKLTSSGSIIIEEPENPPVAKPLIKGSTTVGQCDDLSLDSSSSQGSGGRKMRFLWEVSMDATFDDAVAGLANITKLLAAANGVVYGGNAGQGAAEISDISKDWLFPGAVYTFTIEVKNFLTTTIGKTTHVVRKRDYPIPEVSIRGNAKLQMRRSESTIFYGNVKEPSCGGGGAMNFYWLQVSGNLNLSNPEVGCTDDHVLSGKCQRSVVSHFQNVEIPLVTSTKTASNFRIRPEMLTVGETYHLQLVATMQSNEDINNTALVEIFVPPDTVRASIKGGDRVAGTDDNLILDGSDSIDPDSIPIPEHYIWTCKMFDVEAATFTADCLYYNDRTPLSADAGAITVWNNTLVAAKVYRFTLLFYKGDEALPAGHVFSRRNATTAVTIGPIVEGAPPAVAVQPMKCRCAGGVERAVKCCPPGQVLVNPTDSLRLEGGITSKYPTRLASIWTQMVGDIPGGVMLTRDCSGQMLASCADLNATQVENKYMSLRQKDDECFSSGVCDLELGKKYFTTDMLNPRLVIKSNRLTAGSSYTFRLYANDRGWDNPKGTGYAQIQIKVNSPPSPGSLDVQPSSGEVLLTTFQISCNNWVDAHLPLQYSFAYTGGYMPVACLPNPPALGYTGGLCIIQEGDAFGGEAGDIREYDSQGGIYDERPLDMKQLGDKTTQNKYSTPLPLGSGANYTISVVAMIYDALDASSSTSRSVKVVIPGAGKLNISADNIDTSSPSAAAGSIASLTSILNAGQSSESTSALTGDLYCPGTTGGSLGEIPTECSGHGYCREKMGEKTCDCDNGYVDSDCNTLASMAAENAKTREEMMSKGLTSMGEAETTAEAIDTAADMLQSLTVRDVSEDSNDNAADFAALQMAQQVASGQSSSQTSAQKQLAVQDQLATDNVLKQAAHTKKSNRRQLLARLLNVADNSTADDNHMARMARKSKLAGGTEGNVIFSLLKDGTPGQATQTLSTNNKQIGASVMSDKTAGQKISIGGRVSAKKRRRRRRRLLADDSAEPEQFGTDIAPSGALTSLEGMSGARMLSSSNAQDDKSWAAEPVPEGDDGNAKENAKVADTVGLGYTKADGSPLVVANLSEPVIMKIPITVKPGGATSVYYLPVMQDSRPDMATDDELYDARDWDSPAWWITCDFNQRTLTSDDTGGARRLDTTADPAAATTVGSARDCQGYLQVNITQSCTYFNSTTSKWSTDGCKLLVRNTTETLTVCACTHLTEFSAHLAKSIPKLPDLKKALDPSNISLANLMENPVPLLLLLVMLFTYIFGAFWGNRKDNHDKERIKQDRIKNLFRAHKAAEMQVQKKQTMALSLGQRGEVESGQKEHVHVDTGSARSEMLDAAAHTSEMMGDDKLGIRKAKREGVLFIPGSSANQIAPLPSRVSNGAQDTETVVNITGGGKGETSRAEALNKQLKDDAEVARQKDERVKKQRQLRSRLSQLIPSVLMDDIRLLHNILNSGIVFVVIFVMAVGVDMWFALGYTAKPIIQRMFGRQAGAWVAGLCLAMTCVSVVGYVGNFNRSRPVLKFYSVLMFLAFMAQLGAGGVMYRLAKDLQEYPIVDAKMRTAWIALTQIDKEWAQNEYGCCGYSDKSDYARDPCPEEAATGCKPSLNAAAIEIFEPMSTWGTFAMLVLESSIFFTTVWLMRRMGKEDADAKLAAAERLLLKEELLRRRRAMFAKQVLKGMHILFFLFGIVVATVGYDSYMVGGYTISEPVQMLFGSQWYCGGLLMGIGTLLILQPVLSWLSNAVKQKWTLALSVATSVVLFLAQLVAGVWIIHTANRAESYPQADDEVRAGWTRLTDGQKDLTQQYFNCCGLGGPDDAPAYGLSSKCPTHYQSNCQVQILAKTASAMKPIGILVLGLSIMMFMTALIPFLIIPAVKQHDGKNGLKKKALFDPRAKKPATGYTKLGINLLVGVNVVFIMMGIWAMMIGIDMLYGMGFVAPASVVQVFKGAQYGIGLLIVGFFLLIICGVGIMGAIDRNASLLCLYFTVAFMLFMSQMLIGASFVKGAADLKASQSASITSDTVTSTVDDAMRDLYKQVGDDTKERAQKEFECCGFNNFTDLLPYPATTVKSVILYSKNYPYNPTNYTFGGQCHLPLTSKVVKLAAPSVEWMNTKWQWSHGDFKYIELRCDGSVNVTGGVNEATGIWALDTLTKDFSTVNVEIKHASGYSSQPTSSYALKLNGAKRQFVASPSASTTTNTGVLKSGVSAVAADAGVAQEASSTGVLITRSSCEIDPTSLMPTNYTRVTQLPPHTCKQRLINKAIEAQTPIGIAVLAVTGLEFVALWLTCFLMCRAFGVGEEKEARAAQMIEDIFGKQTTKTKVKTGPTEQLSSVVKFMQVVLIILNSMFILFGSVLLAIAVDLLAGTGTIVDGITAQLYGADFGPPMAIVGFIILLMSSIGMVATIKRNKLALTLYVIGTSVIVVAQIAVATVLMMAASNAEDSAALSDKMRQSWYDLGPETKMLAQNTFYCCGYRNFTDFPPKEMRNMTEVIVCPNNAHQVVSLDGETIPGCETRLLELAKKFFKPASIGSLVVVSIEVATLLFALYLMFKKKHDDDDELARVRDGFRKGGSKLMQAMYEQHTLLSLAGTTSSFFTRPQRMTVIYAQLMGNLMLTVLFYGQDGGDCKCPEVDGITPEYCELCPQPSQLTQIFVAVLMSLILMPIAFAYVMMFKASSNRRPYENAKELAERNKRMRIQSRKDQAEKYKPKEHTPSGVQKLQWKLWTVFYTVKDFTTDARIAAFGHVPPPPNEHEVKIRWARIGFTPLDAQEAGGGPDAKHDKPKSMYPNWVFSPASMRLYQKVLKWVNRTFFFCAMCVTAIGIDLALGLGYTFDGTESSNGIFDVYSRYLGSWCIGLGTASMLTCFASFYGARPVTPTEDPKADTRDLLKRKRVLTLYVVVLTLTLATLLFLARVSSLVSEDDVYASDFNALVIKKMYSSASQKSKNAAHVTFGCCQWEYPASRNHFDQLVRQGYCPREAAFGCEVRFIQQIRAISGAMFVVFLVVSSIVVMCLVSAMLIVKHELQDDSEKEFVFHRGGGAFGLFEAGEWAPGDDEFTDKMRNVLQDQQREADAQSDAEEVDRQMSLLQGHYKKGQDKLGKKLGKDKMAGKKKKKAGPNKSLLEIAYDKVAKVSRDQLKKMHEKDKAAADGVNLEEKEHARQRTKLPWWILHVNYFVIFMFCGFTMYFCFTIFLSYGSAKSYICIQSFMMTFCIQTFVSEPFSIFARTILQPFLLGSLAGSSFGKLAEMAADIGLGAASGIGAVGFADRMLIQRREEAATRAQSAFRGVVGRRLAGKVEAARLAREKEAQEHRERLQNSKALQGDRRVSLFKMASAIANEKTSAQRERGAIISEVTKRGLKPSHSRRRKAEAGQHPRGRASARMEGGETEGAHAHHKRRAHRAQFERQPLNPTTNPVDGEELQTTRKAPASGTVAFKKALAGTQGAEKPKRHAGRAKKRANRAVARGQGVKE
jgi:hypothetical protein